MGLLHAHFGKGRREVGEKIVGEITARILRAQESENGFNDQLSILSEDPAGERTDLSGVKIRKLLGKQPIAVVPAVLICSSSERSETSGKYNVKLLPREVVSLGAQNKITVGQVAHRQSNVQKYNRAGRVAVDKSCKLCVLASEAGVDAPKGHAGIISNKRIQRRLLTNRHRNSGDYANGADDGDENVAQERKAAHGKGEPRGRPILQDRWQNALKIQHSNEPCRRRVAGSCLVGGSPFRSPR